MSEEEKEKQIKEIIEHRIEVLHDESITLDNHDVRICLAELYESVLEMREVMLRLDKNSKNRNTKYDKIFEEKKEQARQSSGLYT